MKLSDVDKSKLLPLLDELAVSVEDLLQGGLTTASDATRSRLTVAFQEASRIGLLRLGATLRTAAEELGRFTGNQPEFSRKRLSFFLNRSWLLCRALAKSVREGDEVQFQQLVWVAPQSKVEKLTVVTLGVSKKVVAGAFCAFDFRLRTVGEHNEFPDGTKLIWSCIFPIKPGTNLPAEAYLHLPQKQKFNAAIFLERKLIEIQNAAVAREKNGIGRISFGESTVVTMREKFSDWNKYASWNIEELLERIESYRASPLDLEVEFQDEIVLFDWASEQPRRTDDGPYVFPLTASGQQFDASVSAGTDGTQLHKKMCGFATKQGTKPPLFGLLHFEKCRFVLQPLSVLEADGPIYLAISEDKIDKRVLLKALNLV